jgi:imidazolonepropionase-like amidohydrolase
MIRRLPRDIVEGGRLITRNPLALLFTCCAIACFTGSSRAEAPAPVVIRAGSFIDVVAGRELANQIIVVRGTRIESVGTDTKIPEGAKVLDLSGMTVLPGLVDCHTHLADPTNAEPLRLLTKTAVETAYETIPNAKVTLLAGFTTVRDVGVYRALNDVAMRDAINNGVIVGPRMYVAGAYVTISEGAGAMTGLSPDVKLPWDMQFGVANSPWEVRERIRELAHRGADHIKVLSTGAVLTHGSNPKSIEFTPEELRAAVEEANNFGLKVAAHAHAAEGIRTPFGRASPPSSMPRSSTMRVSRSPSSTAPTSTWISTTRNASSRRPTSRPIS